ncbi:MAG: UvrD-helicase domain-containing protein [Desulfobacterales bacterium]|nr:UvrD-helicase domain-containing protein [Desulfobacterales bacterium]
MEHALPEKFITDLHIHSKFSRATAKNLDLEHIYMAAMIKGVSVVGTGDFTYPAWIAEIEEKLEPAEPGFFKLKHELKKRLDKEVPKTCHNKVRFILQTEISSIYKKNDRVRKNHNLIFFPEIEIVKKFNSILDKIGNIRSDGRPILGLDAENLLELMLSVDDRGIFIPAHIWTPWFSMFGSKSGFDTIEECFGSLSKHIFAVETGLSSDLPMNFRVQNLDNLSLISNSDAHSPRFIGRNASIFNTDFSYFGIREALIKKDITKYLGTIDMYPELGKYHYDGHRNCNVCFNPVQTLEFDGICPECSKPLTLGVLNRVQKLADRPEGFIPENRHGYQSIVPLADILSEIFKVGPNTKKVNANFNKAIEQIGPELEILLNKSIKEIEKAKIPLLAKAIEKMRQGEITISPGFDGEFGKVKIFKSENLSLFGTKKTAKKKEKQSKTISTMPTFTKAISKPDQKQQVQEKGLNKEQKKIVLTERLPLIVEAGPGTGKTRTLTEKIAHLITEKKVEPGSILALTFTNKAANEMKQRISKMILCKKSKTLSVSTATFHSFCLMILKEFTSFDFAIADNDTRGGLIKNACTSKKIKPADADLIIQKEKQNLQTFKNHGNKTIQNIWQKYESLLLANNLVDFEDLILMTVKLLQKNNDLLLKLQKRFIHIFIDEYQDINKAQYVLIKLIAGNGTNLMVIGDPDQSIYGFRGSDNKYFKQFTDDFPDSKKIILNKNYRSTQTILDASFQLIASQDVTNSKKKIFSDITGQKEKIIIVETASEKAEAVAVGKMIEELIGGTSFLSIDALNVKTAKEYSFADFAILFRTKKQALVFEEIFEKANIPFQSPNKEKTKAQNKDKNQSELWNHEQDFLEFEAEKISLMSIHASKGLEFPVVFVVGCEETFIPFSKNGKTIDNIEEEKRLFYVAMTRAKDILCLTHAKKRMIFGKTCAREKSNFLSSIEENLKQYQNSDFKKKIKNIIAKQLELF